MGITTYDSRKLPDAWQPERRASAPTTHGVPGTAASWGVQTAPMPAVSPMHVQAKLRINQPGDRFEQEADRVADAVVAGRPASLGVQAASGNAGAGNAGAGNAVTGGSVQRKCAECDKEEEERVVQRMAVSTAAPSASSAAATSGLGGGSPLPGATRARMEAVIGADFSGVRVHAGPEAASRASALNARAFTAGRDVVFGAGEYRPGTSSGDRLLAHELTHVVQQGRGLVDGVQREVVAVTDEIVEIPDPNKVEEAAIHKSGQLCVIRLHGDETAAMEAAKVIVAKYRINLVAIRNAGKREITVRANGDPDGKAIATIDPNRMFPVNPKAANVETEASAELAEKQQERLNDKKHGATNDEARMAIISFRNRVIAAINRASSNGGLPTLSLHTNTVEKDTKKRKDPTNVTTFKSGADAMKSAKAEVTNPHVESQVLRDDFVLVTRENDFNAFAAAPGSGNKGALDRAYNTVYQSSASRDAAAPAGWKGGGLNLDGSSSVYFRDRRFVNLEVGEKNAEIVDANGVVRNMTPAERDLLYADSIARYLGAEPRTDPAHIATMQKRLNAL